MFYSRIRHLWNCGQFTVSRLTLCGAEKQNRTINLNCIVGQYILEHWVRVTHIHGCVVSKRMSSTPNTGNWDRKLTSTGPDTVEEDSCIAKCKRSFQYPTPVYLSHCTFSFSKRTKTYGVSQFKVHEYRLVFFWSLVLGVQTPEDRTTGGRSFCDWNSSWLDDVTTSAVLAPEFTLIIHCQFFFSVKKNMTTLLFSLFFKSNYFILNYVCGLYICVCVYIYIYNLYTHN